MKEWQKNLFTFLIFIAATGIVASSIITIAVWLAVIIFSNYEFKVINYWFKFTSIFIIFSYAAILANGIYTLIKIKFLAKKLMAYSFIELVKFYLNYTGFEYYNFFKWSPLKFRTHLQEYKVRQKERTMQK